MVRIAILMLLMAGGPFALSAQAPPSPQSSGEWRTDFSRHSVPLEEILSGGPPKDGIPAIDRPVFETPREADRWLEDEDPMAVLRMGGVVRAYPLSILVWHEIVNDVVAGVPVTVTFCPLCNTTLAFKRELDDRVLDFGTTGRLRHSDLIMYDRQTESWWQQATGEAIVGELTGESLEFVSALLVPWKEVKDEGHPSLTVLSRETGVERDYGRNPYTGYDRRASPLEAFFPGSVDARFPAMERVLALGERRDPVAIPFQHLQEEGVVELEMDGEPVVAFWAAGTASALDARRVTEGRDVGSAVALDPRVDGERLTFEPVRGGRFRDRQTGSTWTLQGRAVRGPLEGRELAVIPHNTPFWFAWITFQPDTRIVR